MKPKSTYQPVGYRYVFDDAALDEMHRTAEPERCYTQAEIAARCGVSRARVGQLEIRALARLRELLEPML